jgi:hypothetical protein
MNRPIDDELGGSRHQQERATLFIDLFAVRSVNYTLEHDSASL